ncbi:hypothetical protein [uncultured Oscillibacter sp.]|uniref:hypothetical protein n=1 Tax=uncultured Oscillibacter sp. TaxID=876091 RepID=UPI0025F8E90E|nr:hypothetical protein [uncultured Oscillibacter sp.]
MKKIYMPSDSGERFLITVASTATKEDAADTLTAETGGDCIGPEDAEESDELAYLLDNWDSLEEMSAEEEDERIAHLADEWGLEPQAIDYLR